MSRFVRLSAGIFVSGIFSGIVFMTAPADAMVSKANRALLTKISTECKAEAKSQKLKWRARRKYVKSCVIGKLQAHPGVDVQELLRAYPDLENLPKASIRDTM